MQNPTEYRKFAEECDRLAQETKGEHQKKVLKEMAKTWKMLADEADRKAPKQS